MNRPKALVIADRTTLARARHAQDMNLVTVRTALLKHRNLLPCALKYALWSLRPGGRLIVDDQGTADAAPPAFVVSPNVVRQWIARFIGRDVEWISVDPGGRVELVRTSPVLPPGWSAGVVFSGQDAEVSVLLKCLDGLRAQPELGPSQRGEIVVCGPARDLRFLSDYPEVRYEEFPSPDGSRFLIGRKKNALMRSMRGPRLCVLHSRIVLEAGALANVPREFDMSSPNTDVFVDGRRETYLSLSRTDSVWPGLAPRRPTLMMRHFDRADPLVLHELGGLFVDGGAFYSTRALVEACPMHDEIAWNEAEDLEWCARAFINGFLIDMACDSPAYSQTNKLRPRPNYGNLTPYLWAAVRSLKTMRAGLQDRIERVTRKR